MRLQSPARRSRAATMVETAFVAAIALLFMFGIFEYGRFVMTKQVMENSAREGARYAVVHTNDGTTAIIQNTVDAKLSTVKKQLVGYNKTTSIQVFASDTNGNVIAGKNWNDTNFGELIGVTITGTYKPVLPSFLHFKTTFTVTTKALMASEGN
jgi:Flp pilus assembly protein TadG